MRSRVTAVFTLSALVLGISAGAIIWGISRAYLVDVRQWTGIRQAQTSAAAIGRLLSPEDPDLPRQAQEFAGVNESGVLITRGSRVLASAGSVRSRSQPGCVNSSTPVSQPANAYASMVRSN